MRASNRIFAAKAPARVVFARASSGHSQPVAPPQPLRLFDEPKNSSLSKEYIQKNFGFLKEPKNKPLPGQTITSGAFNSPAYLQAIAEINATEFNFTKLDAKTLKAKYEEQLTNFESVRRPALEKEGQPAVVIDQLREIYTVRANVALWEVEQAVKELGFLDGRNDLRVTKRSLEAFPVWKVLTMVSPTDPHLFHPSGGKLPKANAELAAENVRIFRGARGLANALQKGLTEDQYASLFKSLEGKVVTPERQKYLLTEYEKIYNSVHDSLPESKNPSRADSRAAFKPFFDSLTTAEREYLLQVSHGSKEVAVATVSSLPSEYDPQGFKQRVQALSQRLASKNPSLAPKLKRFEKAVEFIVKSDTQRKLRLLDLLGRVELSQEEKEELLAPFSDKTFDDALLTDVLNAHPLAERLWGDRMAWIAADNLHYTKHYEDVDTLGLYKDVSEANQSRLKKVAAKRFDAPILGPYPYNSGIEEIMQWKLQLLAEQYLGFDLTSDLGIAQFDSFVHNYDISPGDETLDRVHSYPPPLHTYDELPIIKFDGWDEADVPEDYPEYVAQQKGEAAARPAH